MTVAADFTRLNEVGLNLQAIFNIDDLPAEIAREVRQRFDPTHRYRQLILIGHGGKTLWDSVMAAGIASENPIDEFSVRMLTQWFDKQQTSHQYRLVFPGDAPIGLQTLGKLAGWHHPSPFMIGINEEWGSWYAYRAVALADTDLTPSRPVQGKSPCDACRDKPCVTHCPASALSEGGFDLKACIDYRKSTASLCKASCVARISCPVGARHRYCSEQIAHTYSISMRVIEQHY
jgi:hypothetical protein